MKSVLLLNVCYSPTTVSNITKVTQENVTAFYEWSLQMNYSVFYLEETYLPLQRGTVSKECAHIALSITPDGYKSVFGYEIAPNENNASWGHLLKRLQYQVAKQFYLVITDGFNGLDQAIQQAYPMAKQQRCLLHICRNIATRR
ncbi:transposase [Streptococcus equi subsp. zooepidemicus Sz12is]|nr:transposase [Streptococcus equi subsp. zooepidemicus Sz12is]